MTILLNRSGIIADFIVQDGKGQSCETCGLSGRSAKLMRVPDLPGLYCSLLCAEMGLGARGCRWCGCKLGADAHGSQRFCSEVCKDEAALAKSGDGQRLVAWLAEHAPEIVNHINAETGCLHCGASLAGQRAGAKFCNATCRKQYRRENPICGGLSVAAPAKNAAPVRV